MRRTLVALLVYLAACHPQAPARRVEDDRGQPEDMKTEPGSYAGYDVTRNCRRPEQQTVAIIGTGAKAARWWDAPSDGTHRDEDTAVAWRWLEGAKLTALGIGVGRGCALGGQALHVIVGDWRTVDAVVRAIGAGLAAGNLRGEVDVKVEVSRVDIVD
jgi:hypothetical protein